MLFVWLAPRGEAAIGPGPLELEYSDADPTDALARAAGTCLRQIPLWTIALDAYLSRWGEHHVRPDPLHAALSALPDVVRGLSRALVTLAPTPGILATARGTRAGSRRLWATMTDLSRALLDCLVAGACRFGTLPLAGWEEHLRRLDSFGPVGRCTCDNEVWGQRYGYSDGGPLERHNYQCPVCGPIGEDDGRRLVRLAELPSSVERGALIDATLDCTAPDDEIVQVHAVAVVESLFRDACYVGEPVSVVVAPGAARSVVVRVAAPAELAPGTYPIAILAVVNGASCLIRRFVGVTAARDLRPPAPAAVDAAG